MIFTWKATFLSEETLQVRDAMWPRITLESTGGWMIWVRTRTDNIPEPEMDPASFARIHVYFPWSVERTLAIKRDPSSRIWIRPEKLNSPSVKKMFVCFISCEHFYYNLYQWVTHYSNTIIKYKKISSISYNVLAFFWNPLTHSLHW